MRPDFDEIRTLTNRFVLIPQKVAKFVFGVFRYADLSVLGHLGDWIAWSYPLALGPGSYWITTVRTDYITFTMSTLLL